MQVLKWRRIALVGSLLIGALLAGPLPVGAAATGGLVYQPDGWVRFHSFHAFGQRLVDPTPWKGDGIYNTTGEHQTARYPDGGSGPDDDQYYVFQVTIENEGPVDSFRVKATNSGGNWVTKYFDGKTNITSAVVAGTYETPPMVTGETRILKVKLWLGEANTWQLRRVKITSVSDSGAQDLVRVKVRFEACGC